MNGDGRRDLVVGDVGWGVVSVLLNDGASISLSSQPISQTVSVGGTAVFTSTASGTGPLTYQWRRNGVSLANGGPFSGATTDTLTITNVIKDDVGAYDVHIRGGCNSAAGKLSNPAVLTVGDDGDLDFDGDVDLMDYQLFELFFTGAL